MFKGGDEMTQGCSGRKCHKLLTFFVKSSSVKPIMSIGAMNLYLSIIYIVLYFDVDDKFK